MAWRKDTQQFFTWFLVPTVSCPAARFFYQQCCKHSQHVWQKYQTCLRPSFSSLHQQNQCGWASGVMLYKLCVISATKNKQHNHHFCTTCTALNLQPGLVKTLNLAVAQLQLREFESLPVLLLYELFVSFQEYCPELHHQHSHLLSGLSPAGSQTQRISTASYLIFL